MASEFALHEAASTEHGISAEQQTRLHEVRTRALARQPHDPLLQERVRRWAWLIAVASHVLLLLLLRTAMREPSPPADTDVLQVNIAELPVAEPALPEPPPKTSLRTSRLAAKDTPRLTQPHVSEPANQLPPSDAAPPRLFNEDGIALIPDEAADARQKKTQRGFVQTIESSPLLQTRRPLKVRPNHFAASWNGDDEQPLLYRMWRHLVFEKELTAPWGTRYRCAFTVMVVTTSALGPAMSCADVPEKAWTPPQTWKPATELDER